MSNPQSPHSNESHAGHESTDARARPIAILMVGLAILVFLAMLLMAWLLDLFQIRSDQSEIVPAGLTDKFQIPPQPRLQASPVIDLERLRAREKRELSSYEWIDEATGVMRIPIERAMEITAETGLPARQQTATEGAEGAPLR